MAEEATYFYFTHYRQHWCSKHLSDALACIPQVTGLAFACMVHVSFGDHSFWDSSCPGMHTHLIMLCQPSTSFSCVDTPVGCPGVYAPGHDVG